ncbi:MAG: hypothetical protein PHG85_05845, partial [Candidatus Altiarchaeota archaeon]|nr:hypothetical protein [Candidatus Altiarchaeota archaeon]
MISRKAQIFTLDIAAGTALFLAALITVLYLWDTITASIQESEVYFEMDTLSSAGADQLVRTPGNPQNWTKDNVKVYGLTDVRNVFGTLKYKDRVLDPDKLLQLAWMTKNRYQEVRNHLIGVGKYNMYLQISCLNESNANCFNGLHLDTVNYDVECSNGFVFMVDAGKRMT